MSAAGKLTDAELVEVEPGCFLAKRQARAYRRVKAAFQAKGKTFSGVGKYAYYRSEKVQNAMAEASRSPRGSASRAKYNISSSSTVAVSYSPNGSHQDGRAFDFLIDGSSAYPNADDRALLAKYGWNFQFGNHDPNHVRHDNIHGVVPVTRSWCIKNRLFVQPK